jgi:hypothetical protein
VRLDTLRPQSIPCVAPCGRELPICVRALMSRKPRPVSRRERVEAVRQILRQFERLAARDPQLDNGRIRRQTIFYLYERPLLDKFCKDRPHSLAARSLRKRGGRAWAKGRRYDHSIPLVTLKAKLRRACTSHANFEKALRRYIYGAVITKAEDARLQRLGLGNTMPTGRFDCLARYRKARIKFSEQDLELFKRMSRRPR